MPPSFRLPLPRISLRHVCLGGLFLVFLLCGGLILISLYSGVSLFPSQGIAAREDTFYRDLREYDALLAQSRENPERLSGLLDRLEKKALGVESHLAVLKRRRALAQENSRFLP
ncbi:MAG: hypothetical protein LBT95_08510, partial [Treponema sp.]|nr:hypothetical protein [Treponema sp.]